MKGKKNRFLRHEIVVNLIFFVYLKFTDGMFNNTGTTQVN